MTIVVTLELVPIECADCHIIFGVPVAFELTRRRDHETFCCPAGHDNYFPGESDLERAERFRRNAVKRSELAEADARRAREQAKSAARSRAAVRGHLTRTKRRLVNGVCPCCDHEVPDLAAHLADQHPDYLADEREQADEEART